METNPIPILVPAWITLGLILIAIHGPGKLKDGIERIAIAAAIGTPLWGLTYLLAAGA